ncbi:MAG: oligoendopeptidase F [Armatimonadetes bacterium]|nr:oligoendopeptidase F [Armatimonadota bacterium]
MQRYFKLILIILFSFLFFSPSLSKDVKEVEERAKISSQYKWNLEDIYANLGLWEKDFKKVKSLIPKFKNFQGRLNFSADILLKALELKDQINQINDRLFVYAKMHYDEDTANIAYQTLASRAETLNAETIDAFSFVSPEILALSQNQINSFYKKEKRLNFYKQYINNIRRAEKHFLSSKEETIIAKTLEMGSSPKNIFEMAAYADMQYPKIKDEAGKELQLTPGVYSLILETAPQSMRREAFKGIYSAYLKQKNTFGAVLYSSCKKDEFYAKIRKYSSTLEAALDEDNIPVKVYDNLINTVNAHLSSLHRYMILRKKILGLSELHPYDLYAPLIREKKFEIPYEKAQEIILQALSPLGKEYQEIARMGFSSRWIDVYENKAKRSGAYSWGAYGTHPYMLLNYMNTLDDLFTLTHEMGHSAHTYYSNKGQAYLYSQYPIFIAEVASTFNEVLLINYLLEHSQDKNEKLYLLDKYLEMIRGTVYTQTMFAEFEKKVHELSENGAALNSENFSKIYFDLLKKYYGPDVALDPEIAMGWARISHFYSSFYVYKYVTGFSAASYLARNVLKQKPQAQSKYLTLLKSGSIDYPLNLLKKAGVDMSSPEPILATLNTFENLLKELEELLEKT